MYADYFLKFADQAEADAILYTEHPEVVDEDGNVTSESYQTPNYQNIDVLGVIYEEPESEDAEPVARDGWHVNVRIVVDVEAPDALIPYMVHPEHPRRVWAGPMYPVTE